MYLYVNKYGYFFRKTYIPTAISQKTTIILAMFSSLYAASSTALSLEHPRARNASHPRNFEDQLNYENLVNFGDFNCRNSCKDTSLFPKGRVCAGACIGIGAVLSCPTISCLAILST